MGWGLGLGGLGLGGSLSLSLSLSLVRCPRPAVPKALHGGRKGTGATSHPIRPEPPATFLVMYSGRLPSPGRSPPQPDASQRIKRSRMRVSRVARRLTGPSVTPPTCGLLGEGRDRLGRGGFKAGSWSSPPCFRRVNAHRWCPSTIPGPILVRSAARAGDSSNCKGGSAPERRSQSQAARVALTAPAAEIMTTLLTLSRLF